MYRQFKLTEKDDGSVLVCWLTDDPRLRVGAFLTLDEFPDRVWRIGERFKTTLKDHPRRTWRVGGLT